MRGFGGMPPLRRRRRRGLAAHTGRHISWRPRRRLREQKGVLRAILARCNGSTTSHGGIGHWLGLPPPILVLLRWRDLCARRRGRRQDLCKLGMVDCSTYRRRRPLGRRVLRRLTEASGCPRPRRRFEFGLLAEACCRRSPLGRLHVGSIGPGLPSRRPGDIRKVAVVALRAPSGRGDLGSDVVNWSRSSCRWLGVNGVMVSWKCYPVLHRGTCGHGRRHLRISRVPAA